MATLSLPHQNHLISTKLVIRHKPRFAVSVGGVTAAVRREFLSPISDRDFSYRSSNMLASKRSAGGALRFKGAECSVKELTAERFDGVDIAPFSAGGSVSREFGPVAVDKGTIVVDNSSAFRMDENVPLMIPEGNPEAMEGIKLGMGKGVLIANPNYSTIMAATPLHWRAKVPDLVVSTYQAGCDAGAYAPVMEELGRLTLEVLEGRSPAPKIFEQKYAFNLLSHNASVLSNGYNEEEMKMVKEIRNDKDVKVTATWIRVPVMRAHAESLNLLFERPLNDDDRDLKVTAMCTRVPVMRAHAESGNPEFEQPLDEDTARDILKNAPGTVVVDDRETHRFPTPLVLSPDAQ